MIATTTPTTGASENRKAQVTLGTFHGSLAGTLAEVLVTAPCHFQGESGVLASVPGMFRL